MVKRWLHLVSLVVLLAAQAWSQVRRKVIIDEDCAGPGGSNLQAMMTFIQSPQVEPLGVAVVTGDQWRDEEMAHTLRLLEIVGRPDIPVLSRSSVSACPHPRRNGSLGKAVRQDQLPGRLGSALVARAVRGPATSRGATHHPAVKRRRRAFHDPHGARVPTSGDNLRGRSDDRRRARSQARPRVRLA